ncbi:MAG: trypsin-like peptidase domain-containing protein [Pseudonocardiaceae bacterium]
MARIRSHTGEVVGSGFVVATSHVVTCAHVVARALGRKTREAPAETDTVSLDFPLVAAGVTVQARVAVWHPIEDDDKGDIAVLALVSDPPAGVLPACLVTAEDFWSHPFRTFGFPRRYDHGVWASGVLRARQAAGWVQMETSSSGYAVEAGFSGAAVWDDELAGVVGMTVAADARSDRGAAYLIPTEELIRAWPQLADRTVPPCPYRGLYPFRERDVSVFYGRQDLTDLLVTEVRRRPLVAVVGPSGSGKSSVVFAGLLPRIVQQQGWLCLGMRPAHASSPLAALAAAFLPFLDPDQAETERLAALGQLTTLLSEGHLPDVVDRVLTRAGKTDLLLVVDQCEELFAREDSDASEFLTVLLPAPHTPRSLTVVLTLRADFLGQALQDPALAAALEGSVTTIGQMGRDQLRAVIEGPLPKDVTYEAGLVERILGDLGEEPGSLPLLEFALTLLWERQDQGTLTHSAYEHLGGVSGALASYAERVYLDQLLPDDQEEARRLLIQLIRPSDVGQPVRRIARRPELGEPRWQLAQRLAATRLLVTDRDPTGVESVELVHEALISRWSRLYEWFDADLAFRTWQEQLRGSLIQWETAQHNEGALLRGTPLAEAERWLTERPDDLGTPEQQFIQASRALRTRSVRRLRMVAAVLALLVLAASSLGGVALWQRNQVKEENQQIQSRELATQANSLADYKPDLAMLLAATAYKIAPTREAVSALTSMASKWRHVDRLLATDMTGVSQIAFSPTDPTIVALTNPNRIEVRDLEKNIPRSGRDADGVGTPAFSRDGRIIAYTQKTEQGNEVVLWSHAANQVVRKIPFNLAPEESFDHPTFSPDGTLLGACVGRRIQLWSPDTDHPYRSVPLTHVDTRCAFGFRNGNRELAYTDGDDIITWDIAAGKPLTVDQPDPPKRRQSSPLSSRNNQSFFGDGSGFAVTPDGRSAIYQGQIYDDDSGGFTTIFGRWDFDRRQAQKIEYDAIFSIHLSLPMVAS